MSVVGAVVEGLPGWALLAAYGAFWVLAGIVTRAILKRWLLAIAAHEKTAWTEVVAATLPRPAGVVVFLVGVSAGLRYLPIATHAEKIIRHLIPIALLLVGVVALMRVALQAIAAFGKSSPHLQSTAGLGRALTWVLGLGLCALLVSEAMGVSLAPILTAFGVGSLAVALALQDTLTNFFAGIYLVADKRVRPGDFIRMDPSYEGYVDSIGWRSTQLKTSADNLVIVPNSTLSKAVITNFSRPTAQVACSVRIDVAHDADIDKVEELLADEAKRAIDIPAMATSPAPVVQFAPGFVDGALAFTIYFQVATFGDQGGVQHTLRLRVLRRLRSANIAIASAVPLVKRA